METVNCSRNKFYDTGPRILPVHLRVVYTVKKNSKYLSLAPVEVIWKDWQFSIEIISHSSIYDNTNYDFTYDTYCTSEITYNWLY
jgi:hypothetical protein